MRFLELGSRWDDDGDLNVAWKGAATDQHVCTWNGGTSRGALCNPDADFESCCACVVAYVVWCCGPDCAPPGAVLQACTLRLGV